MSDLIFDGKLRKLIYFTKGNQQIGEGWYANNVVDRSIRNLRFLPNRVYRFLDRNRPHRHHGSADSPNGSFGSYGIFRLQSFSVNGVQHDGVGVHSGRANKGGADHATHGCIRTTDDVMQALCYYILNDPLDTLLVINNHDQHNRFPHHKADPHRQMDTKYVMV